jgi:parvulin-like peptidyl-prolyl isomerase
VSPPVRTRFGVHLIRYDAVKPGDRGLAEVRKEVEEALARELLEKLAAVQRRSTRVEYADRPPGG